MTIAVGFACPDGMVLAVDSEVSTSTDKYDGEKSWFYTFPEDGLNSTLKVGIVGAGDVQFLRYASQRIAHVLSEGLSVDDVQGLVQAQINDIHVNHIYPYPDTQTRPEIELLIGIWTPTRSRLLATNLTTVSKASVDTQNRQLIDTSKPAIN